MSRPIFLLTDFGLADTYVGQLKAVIAGIAPASTVIDLTHEVSSFAIDEGAFLLEAAMGALPPHAVVVAVVDPGVGTDRKPLAIRLGDQVWVGPDNGLLSCVFPDEVREHAKPGGGPVTVAGAAAEVRELCEPQFRRARVSTTFHGRDIFAPGGAYLASGVDFSIVGPPVTEAVLLPPFSGLPGEFGQLNGSIVHIDRYGNAITTIRASQVFPAFELRVGQAVIDRHVRTFASAPHGVPFCHVDSTGYLAIAMNQGNAAATLGLHRGQAVSVCCR